MSFMIFGQYAFHLLTVEWFQSNIRIKLWWPCSTVLRLVQKPVNQHIFQKTLLNPLLVSQHIFQKTLLNPLLVSQHIFKKTLLNPLLVSQHIFKKTLLNPLLVSQYTL